MGGNRQIPAVLGPVSARSVTDRPRSGRLGDRSGRLGPRTDTPRPGLADKGPPPARLVKCEPLKGQMGRRVSAATMPHGMKQAKQEEKEHEEREGKKEAQVDPRCAVIPSLCTLAGVHQRCNMCHTSKAR